MTKEMVGGCCVCSDERGWQENPLVYCDGRDCSVAVHQACYGIVSVPAGPWFCEKCLSQEKSAKVKCELCPMREGAVKHADNGGWAHVVCALYIPEVRFGNVTTMDPIILSGVPADRFSKVCYICEERGLPEMKTEGACMQCNKLGCKAAFHVTCAQQEGLLCEESGQMDNIKYCGYCSHHFKKIKKDTNIKVVPPYKPVKSFRNANNDTAALNSTANTNNNSLPGALVINHQLSKKCNQQSSLSNNISNSVASVVCGAGSSPLHASASATTSNSNSPKMANNGCPIGGGAAAGLAPPFSPQKDPPTRMISTKNSRLSPINHNGGGAVNSCKVKQDLQDGFSHNATLVTSPYAVPSQLLNHNGPAVTAVSGDSATALNSQQHLINSIVNVASMPMQRGGGVTSTGFGGGGGGGSPAGSVAPGPVSSSSSSVGSAAATSSTTGLTAGQHSPLEASPVNGPSAVNPAVPATRVPNYGIPASELMPPPSQQRHNSKNAASSILHDPFEGVMTAISPPVSTTTTPTPTSVTSSSSAVPKRRSNHETSSGGTKGTNSGSTSSQAGAPAPKKSRRNTSSNKNNIALLLNQVSSVVEDTVSSFQREKVQASQQLLLQQQRQQQQQQQRQQQTSVNGLVQTHIITSSINDLNNPATKHNYDGLYGAACSSGRPMPCSSSSSSAPFGGCINTALPSNLITGSATMMSTLSTGALDKKNSPSHHTDSITDLAPYSTATTILKPSVRSLSCEPHQSSFPTSLEQLLERQWEQGSQFLMEQAQHFDIASLLSCLQQLKVENQRLEDHIVNLISRRDHLLAVNARLSLLLGPQQPPQQSQVSQHPSPHSPRVQQQQGQSSAGQTASTSHDFQLESLVNANNALSRIAAIAVSSNTTPSASKSFQSITNASGPTTVMVSPPIVPSRSTGTTGAFNTVVNPSAAAAAAAYASLLCPPQGKGPPNSGAMGQHKTDTLSNVTVNNPGSTSALVGLSSVVQQQQQPPPQVATSSSGLQQQQQQQQQNAAVAAAAAAGAFVLPQLHSAAAASQLAEHIVRSHTPLLPHQFALAQDPHHQQMLFQMMQQQAVAYNNVLSGMIQQPTTSPHHPAGPAQPQPSSNQQTAPSVHQMSVAGKT